MSPDLRTLTLQNIPDAIHVINESSRGTSLECPLDLVRFLFLSRYWNFSYAHSLIRYVENEPAAVVINCTDPEHQDAFTFYWGAVPKFRSQRRSLNLFDACCNKLHDDGYTTLHGISVPDRQVRRYRFIQAHAQHDLVDMETMTPALPAAEPRFAVRPIDIDIVSQVALPPSDSLFWCQRHSFLRNATPFFQFAGAFQGDALQAYMVVEPGSTKNAVIDLRSPESCFAAGYELLRWLLQHYQPPFTATHVLPGSYAHGLLTGAGFDVKREFSLLTRDLRATCSAKAGDM